MSYVAASAPSGAVQLSVTPSAPMSLKVGVPGAFGTCACGGTTGPMVVPSFPPRGQLSRMNAEYSSHSSSSPENGTGAQPNALNFASPGGFRLPRRDHGVSRTFPLLRPVSTYRCASTTCSKG